MGEVIETANDGPFVRSSTYWGSGAEAAGKVWVSVNAGAVRVLLPRSARAAIRDMAAGRVCVLSRGPWPAQRLAEAVEILFDDGSDDPFSIHLSPESFDMLPADPGEGRGWELTVWEYRRGRPHMVLRRPCHWRRVPKLPWLRPLDAAPEGN